MSLAREPRRTVALVHYAAPPIIGGVESVIGAHARLMLADGHGVRIVAARGLAPPSGSHLRLLPLIDPRHPLIEAVQAELGGGRVPAGFGDLVEELRHELEGAFEGVDTVIAHNVCSLNLNLALTAALRAIADREASPRFILWHHDLAAVMPDYRAALHDGWPWSLLREAWPGTTQVVVSESRCRQLAEVTGIDPGAIAVVPNGVDLERAWKLEPEAAALFERITRLGIELLLLVPARITGRKNIELALHVVAGLRSAGRSAAVVVTGPVDPHRPGEQDYLDRLLQLRSELGLDEAAWLLAAEAQGGVPDAVVSDLYRMSDLLFLPSRDEGFGLPILEAAASRLPIACSDLPAFREIAGPDALYFELDDPPAQIAARILEQRDADPGWRIARRVRYGYAWNQVYRLHIGPLLGS